MDCFAALAMTTSKRFGTMEHIGTRERRALPAQRLLHYFVDGIFTTFIERPFTKVSHAFGKNHAMSCV
jgi:hypothetical protein